MEDVTKTLQEDRRDWRRFLHWVRLLRTGHDDDEEMQDLKCAGYSADIDWQSTPDGFRKLCFSLSWKSSIVRSSPLSPDVTTEWRKLSPIKSGGPFKERFNSTAFWVQKWIRAQCIYTMRSSWAVRGTCQKNSMKQKNDGQEYFSRQTSVHWRCMQQLF